jgi:hypothetical protein
MSSDWLDELNAIREADKAKQEAARAKALEMSLLKRSEQASLALKKCQAHKLLRRVQSVLLGGQGTLDMFDRDKSYDRALALVWQGPVSEARIPRADDPDDFYYILVGARGDKLFVNGTQVKPVTPEALKPALVEAARKPLRWSSDERQPEGPK